MSRACLIFITLAAGLTFWTLPANAATYFTANLNSAQEVPPTNSTANGFGRVTLNETETQINVSIYYSGLTSGVTGGHIHGPAPVGSNAGILFNLNPALGQTGGSVVNSSFSVTPAQVADLKAGLWYFNIHTNSNTGGEIRGQLFLDSPFVAYMESNQEVGPTGSSARGSGFVSLNETANQALVTMSWSGLTGNAAAAHIHAGRSGTNGGIVCNLSPAAATSGSVVDVLCTLTAQQVTALKQAQLYLNVHTGQFPGGEIRGQIQRRRSTVVDFDGDSRTDYAIVRNNAAADQIEWWILNSAGGVSAFPHGSSAQFHEERLMACDFDGDGRDDAAVWHSAPTPEAGFAIFQSGDFTVRFEQFGTIGDDPRVVYDYDGDGRCDPAVWRSSSGTWFFLGSANNPDRNLSLVRWGASSDRAHPGDFNGDGRGDFAVQRGADWWIFNSGDHTVRVVRFGTNAFVGTPGDYDGDGKTDVAGSISETEGLAWYYVASSNPNQNIYLTRRLWGPNINRFRAQGDYDGDGRSDYAVYVTNASIGIGFWVLPSDGGPHIFVRWGVSTDFPVAGYNNR